MLLFQPAHAFQPKECGVPLVHVVNGGLQSQSLEGAIPADAEEDLLFEPHLEIAAVKLVGDDAVLGAVGRKVGIEQEKRHAADLRPPHLRRHRAAGIGYFHRDGGPGERKGSENRYLRTTPAAIPRR